MAEALESFDLLTKYRSLAVVTMWAFEMSPPETALIVFTGSPKMVSKCCFNKEDKANLVFVGE
tara:strand:- start:39339 stop:39527 length:189 start_codon:yes stop_codon:yes gene_type:complete